MIILTLSSTFVEEYAKGANPVKAKLMNKVTDITSEK